MIKQGGARPAADRRWHRLRPAVKAEEKGLALEVQMDDRLPAHLLGDPVKIDQVLTTEFVGKPISPDILLAKILSHTRPVDPV